MKTITSTESRHSVDCVPTQTLCVDVELAKELKSITAAIFFGYFSGLTDRQRDSDGWIYKTQQEICQDTGLSKWQQQRARKILRKFGMLEEKAERLDHKQYYRVINNNKQQ